jgi:hypothetical protein
VVKPHVDGTDAAVVAPQLYLEYIQFVGFLTDCPSSAASYRAAPVRRQRREVDRIAYVRKLAFQLCKVDGIRARHEA